MLHNRAPLYRKGTGKEHVHRSHFVCEFTGQTAGDSGIQVHCFGNASREIPEVADYGLLFILTILIDLFNIGRGHSANSFLICLGETDTSSGRGGADILVNTVRRINLLRNGIRFGVRNRGFSCIRISGVMETALSETAAVLFHLIFYVFTPVTITHNYLWLLGNTVVVPIECLLRFFCLRGELLRRDSIGAKVAVRSVTVQHIGEIFNLVHIISGE